MAGRLRFKYSPDGQRNWQEVWFDALNVRRTVYVGAYERDIAIGPFGSTEHRYALAPGVLSIRRENDTSNRTGVYYNHSDRLGSTSTITRADGTVVSQNGFDPFGMPRSGDWARPTFGWSLSSTINGAGLTNPPITRRGFTDHEQLDQVRLTHMNGRLYDYRLGRFMGVDPIIQFPTNSQSLNPYSYIMNNPLSGTDPTGYEACGAELPGRGDVCEITKTTRTTPAGSRIARTTVQTFTVANNGGDIHMVPGTGRAAYDALVSKINGYGGVSTRSESPQISAPPVEIVERCSGVLGMCTARIEDASQPSWVPKYFGDAWASWGARHNSGNIAINPLTGQIVSDRQSHIGLMMDLASIFAGGRAARLAPSAAVSDRLPNITERALNRIESHLDAVLRNQSLPIEFQAGERGMLSRLRAGERSSQDIEFFMHELKESAVFRRTGDLQFSHQSALDFRRVSERDLFHPEVIKEHPELFNDSWR